VIKMSILFTSAVRAGYAAGKMLPGAIKVVAAKAPTLTVTKVAVVTGHAVVSTAKIAGAVVVGLFGAHFMGF
jgi:hypothetical protein